LTEVRLTWANLDPPPDSYKVEYHQEGTQGWTKPSGDDPKASPFNVTGLSKTTAYEFRVSASSKSGLGAPSASAKMLTSDCPGRGAANANTAVNYDLETPYQVRGGEVHFTLSDKNDDVQQVGTLPIRVCFRWHSNGKAAQWLPTPDARVVRTESRKITWGVLVPDELRHRGADVARTGPSLVPLADMHIFDTKSGAPRSNFDIVEQLGISNSWWALGLAAAAAIAAWTFAFIGGTSRSIRGGPILRVISTRNGTAACPSSRS
jgi:hypothetical protein